MPKIKIKLSAVSFQPSAKKSKIQNPKSKIQKLIADG
jgi:hypothetical protein